MTEKRQETINNCLRIFNIIDILDKIGDSDNDNDDILGKFGKSRKPDLCAETDASAPAKSKDIEPIVLKWNPPTKGLMDGENPLEIIPTDHFIKNYRFSKECVQDILQMISYGLSKFTNRGKPFSPMVQLLITLQFLATGTEE